MKKRILWVVEMKDSEDDWSPSSTVGHSRKDALNEKDWMIITNPGLKIKYRVVKYVAEEKCRE